MKVVVKREQPLRTALVVVLGVVAVLSAAVYFVDAERTRFDGQINDLRKERRALIRENRSLKRENESLSRRVAVVERSTQIEARAYAQVNAHLRALQDELQLVKEEVSFYQGILGDGQRLGVRIQRLVLEPGDIEQRARYRLVLTRSSEDNDILAGMVSFSVEGERDGARRILDHRQIESPDRDGIPFSFRHFQRIEGLLTLPENFSARSVIVQVSPDSESSRTVRETLEWPARSD